MRNIKNELENTNSNYKNRWNIITEASENKPTKHQIENTIVILVIEKSNP